MVEKLQFLENPGRQQTVGLGDTFPPLYGCWHYSLSYSYSLIAAIEMTRQDAPSLHPYSLATVLKNHTSTIIPPRTTTENRQTGNKQQRPHIIQTVT